MTGRMDWTDDGTVCPNAHVCVYLTVHITKLQLQTTFLVKLIELCIKIWRFFLKPNSIMAIEIFI
jgi:hypothetical protein